MLAVALLTIVAVLFHLRSATPILHLAIHRPASSHPPSAAEKAPNPPRQKTGSVQIPIAPDAPPRHIFRGFLLWRFAYAGPRCAPRHLHGAGIRKPSQKRRLGRRIRRTRVSRVTCKICSKFGWHVNRLTNENTGLQEGSDMERLGRNREARVSSWAIRFIQLQASHGAGQRKCCVN
jgi:hypothetical protein